MNRNKNTFAKKAKPLRRQKTLSEEIVAQISDDIVSGALSPGQKLPTEQEQMEHFGVSRTVIREAISALRSDGLLNSKQGLGVFVSEAPQMRPFRIEPEHVETIRGVLDIMELRMSIEIESAGLAAERRTDEQITQMVAALKAIDDELENGNFSAELDFGFHRSIAEATGNEYFVKILGYLGSHIIPRQSVRVGPERIEDQSSYMRRIHEEHRLIFDAIVERNPDVAREQMRNHIEAGRQRYENLILK